MPLRTSQYRSVAPALIEQRAIERHMVSVRGITVRPHGEQPSDAALHDISIFGCRVAAVIEVAAGDRLWLRFPSSMPVAATVVWHDGAFIGCRFDTPIERALVRALGLPSY